MLENSKVNIKIKLSVLWTSVMFCYVYGDYFELYVPEKVESLLSGTHVLDSPLKLVIASVVLTIPAVLIALSVMLPSKINRLTNIVVGSLYSLMMLIIAFNSLTLWYGFYAFLGFVESIITLVIVYNAWKWPKIEQD
ncbi:DUF6326 family protein [Pseudofulvibacter geojedonensis]|uniref:DUF6326 family protein n=1 Tax=Pseudofulvibacter geojedonensis TaxID=1123758 RepID=A0ABW3I2C3_9FLAO